MKNLLVRSGAAIAGISLVLLGASSVPQTVSGSGRLHDAQLVAEAHAAFIKAMSAHAPAIGKGGAWVSPGIRHTAGARASKGPVTESQSANWSGFADAQPTGSTSTFSAVSGKWTIPAVRCLPAPYQNQDAFLAQWVGIDGYTNGTVEQLGTATQCFEGVIFYYDWYEMYPSGTVEEGTTACINSNVDCPQPGDRISASVTVTPGTSGQNNYSLSLTDQSRPQESFSVSQQCAATTCMDQSAEWIIERPATLPAFNIIQILPLADYDQTSFSAGHDVFGGVSSSIGNFAGPVNDIAMTDDTASYLLDCVGQPAPPGSLLLTTDTAACPAAEPDGNGRFSATWDASF